MSNVNRNQDKVVPLTVFVPEHLRAGNYANLVGITTTGDGELMLDFVFSHPQDAKGNVKRGSLVSRVILPEQVARRMLNILHAHLGKTIKE